MHLMLLRNWWTFALRGVVAILFGIVALAWPAMTLAVLILVFGAFAIVDGLFAILAGLAAHGSDRRWWAEVAAGVVGVAVGLMTFVWPGITALTLLYFIATWAIVLGILQIFAAIQLRAIIRNEWVMVLSGFVAIAFGVALFLSPAAGALGLLWVIGVYAMAFGVLSIVLAFRMRALQNVQVADSV